MKNRMVSLPVRGNLLFALLPDEPSPASVSSHTLTVMETEHAGMQDVLIPFSKKPYI